MQRYTAQAVYLGTLAFYLIPITVVSGMLSIAKLTQTFPALRPLLDNMGPEVRRGLMRSHVDGE